MYDHHNLSKMGRIAELAPDAFRAFQALDTVPFRTGVIPLKYKELAAVAVALTTQCPYCLEIHSARAREAGATGQELAEVVLIAASLRAGAAVTHGTHVI